MRRKKLTGSAYGIGNSLSLSLALNISSKTVGNPVLFQSDPRQVWLWKSDLFCHSPDLSVNQPLLRSLTRASYSSACFPPTTAHTIPCFIPLQPPFHNACSTNYFSQIHQFTQQQHSLHQYSPSFISLQTYTPSYIFPLFFLPEKTPTLRSK